MGKISFVAYMFIMNLALYSQIYETGKIIDAVLVSGSDTGYLQNLGFTNTLITSDGNYSWTPSD